VTGNMDILFINPPYERLKGFSLESVPNGILGLATYVNQNGYKALVYDVDTNATESFLSYNNKNRAESQGEYAMRIDDDEYYIWKEVQDTIRKLDPKFVGITLMTPTLHSGLKVSGIAKGLGKVVLAGGPHVNIVQDAILKLNEIDYCFFGEAEFAIVEFFKSYPDIEKISHIRGIGFKVSKKTIYNGISERITNLDSLPYPDRELLIYRERYLKTGLSSIMASRGCPFNCSFCASVPIWGRNAEFRSPEHIVKEIKHLHDTYEVKEFRFFDDTFTVKKENVINFCKILIDTFGKKYFKWWCLSRINSIDENVLFWLREAGCTQIHYGVESGSDRILKLMHKAITIKQVESVVALTKKHGFWVNTFFIIGIPYEKIEDMRKTIDFIKKIKPDSVNLCTFTPYPGTELYNYCVKKRLIKHDDSYEMFKYIGHHSSENYFLEDVSREDYKKLLDEILELTTNVSNSITIRKFMYRFKMLTFGKIARKSNLKIRKMLISINKNGFI